MSALDALRVLKARAIGQNDSLTMKAFVERTDWPKRSAILKAAVSGLDTGDVDATASRFNLDFQAAVRALSVVGRLTGLRRLPVHVPLLTQRVGSRARWTGEGRSRALTAGSYVRSEMILLAVAALSVATDEMLSAPNGLADAELLRDLLAACSEALDVAFLDPLNAGAAGVTPASVTSTVTPIVAGGASIADLNQALAEAVDKLVAVGGSNLTSAAWVMRPEFGVRMGLAREDGGLAWPGVGALGGALCGLPVLTSASMSTDADSDGTSSITLIDAAQIAFSEGEPVLRTSKNASVTMSDVGPGDTITPTSAGTLVSMFQTDTTALMAQLRVNWAVRRPGAVQVITGARLEIGS